ncbi:MAG: hypothetical protein R6V10_02290 [bacterium]
MRGKRGQDMETIRIITTVEEMSAGQVMERIGKRAYEALRRNDPRPMFVELLAGHEGWSTGNMVTGSRKKKTRKFWSKEKIIELAQRLSPGVPLYLSHERPGTERAKVGEIKAAWQSKKGRKAGASALAHITDPAVKNSIREGQLDTCSIEAEVVCKRDQGLENDSWLVSAINKVTGVALGKKSQSRPGFPAAAVLAMVEEFENDEPQEPSQPDQERESHCPDSNPSELFSKDTLENDPVVKEIITSRRHEDEERIHELSRKIEDYEAKANQETAASRAEDVARRELAGSSLRESEKDIILDELRRRPPENTRDLEAKVKSRIETEVEKMKKLRKLWSREFIPSPPEKEKPKPANPLIPAGKK